jgi:predicted Fe-Mo cluster-binding NifX family protein
MRKKCKQEGWTLITGDLTEGAPKAIAFLETCITARADVVILQNIADGAYDDLLKQIRDQGARKRPVFRDSMSPASG